MGIAHSVSLQEWDGEDFVTRYTWRNVPAGTWVELSVGRVLTALGASLGCKDMQDWSRCKASGECDCDLSGGTAFQTRRLQGNGTGNFGNGTIPDEDQEVEEWNCTRYFLEGMCNDTYYDEIDCEGM